MCFGVGWFGVIVWVWFGFDYVVVGMCRVVLCCVVLCCVVLCCVTLWCDM